MTLKSKKVLEQKHNNKNNIRSKQRGGSKYTIVGHEKKNHPPDKNKSDLTTSEGYLLSKYDVKIVEDFLRNVKGDSSDFYELSDKSEGTEGLEGITTETKFNVFVDKLQQIISTGGRTTGEDSLLVETGSGDQKKELEKPVRDDGSKAKNVEINTKFLRDILKKISSGEQDLILEQQTRTDIKTNVPGDETDKVETRTIGSVVGTPLLGEKSKSSETSGRKDYKELPTVNKDSEISNVKILLDDLKEIYSKYKKKYESQSGDENFGSFFKNSNLEKSNLSKTIKQTYYKDLKSRENQKRFKTLDSGLNTKTGDNYFFSTEDENSASYLKHKFNNYTPDNLQSYSTNRKTTNLTIGMALGEGENEQTATDQNVEYEGRMGFEITDIESEEIRDRYQWCYLMERIYLFKHMELLQLVINITYIINSLFIMYFLFTRIVRLRDVSNKPCPVPNQVVLPPTYRKIIQNYFNTQRGDLIHINNQIRDTVVGIQNVLNSSMGVTNIDSNTNKGIPKEYKDFAVSSDFLNKPLSFASYDHLIKSSKLHIPTIYLFPSDNISGNQDALRNAIIDAYPGDKKNVVINVRFDESVYRSRKMNQKEISGSNEFTYNDKYRYRREKKSDGELLKPIKIIISKAESYDKIKEYFDTLVGMSLGGIDFTANNAKHELSFIKFKSSNEELLDITNDNFDGDDGVFVKDTAGNLGQKVGNFRALKKDINANDLVLEMITPQNYTRKLSNDFIKNEKVKINKEIIKLSDKEDNVVDEQNKFTDLTRDATTKADHKAGDIVMGEGKIVTPTDGTPISVDGVDGGPTTVALKAAIASSPTLNTVTGDVVKTASLIVNLKKIPVLGDDSIKNFLYGSASSAPPMKGLLTAMTLSGKPTPDVVYFNIYRNQLKIVLGFSEEFANLDIDNSLKQLENERNNIFVGEFEQQDKTRSIIYTSLQQTGGSFQIGGAAQRKVNFDDATEFSDTVKNVYGNDSIPSDENAFKEYTYGYKVGSTYKIPFSLTEEQVKNFKDLGTSSDNNPYLLASEHSTYEKFKISSDEQIKNYINQYKNIKELVIDSKSNNKQLKNMIEFLNNDDKKSLHDFKQQVLIRDLEINSIAPDKDANQYTAIELNTTNHGLEVGDMVNIKATGAGTEPYLFNDVALKVIALGDKLSDATAGTENTHFIVNVGDISSNRFSFASNNHSGKVTAFSDEFDLHRLNLLDSKVEEMPDAELYSPEHIQLYLNRCYELEKLYIIKHHEFLYMKNVFDKAFIFYLMSFIVFFYYVKSLGKVEKTKCKDSLIRIPKTFLGDIDLMVKNQKNIMDNFTQETPFKTIQSVIDTDQPKFSLSGGANMLIGGSAPPEQSISKTISDVVLELKTLITFINETNSKKNYSNFSEVLTELKKNKNDEYKNAKEYLEKLFKQEQKLSAKTIKTEKEQEEYDKISKFLNDMTNFISGVCGGETSVQTSILSDTTTLCNNEPKVNINQTIVTILDGKSNPDKFDETLKTILLDKTNSYSFNDIDLVKNIVVDNNKTFEERLENIFDNVETPDDGLENSIALNIFSRDDLNDVRDLSKVFNEGKELNVVTKNPGGQNEYYEINNSDSDFSIKISKSKLELLGGEIKIETNNISDITFDVKNENNAFIGTVQTLLKNDTLEFKKLIFSQTKLKDLYVSLLELHEMLKDPSNSFLEKATNEKTQDFTNLDYIIKNYKVILNSISYKIFKKGEPYPTSSEVETSYTLNENNEYKNSFMDAIKDKNKKKFILNITKQQSYDCISAMNNIVDKNLEKQKLLSYISLFLKDSSKTENQDNLKEVFEFLQINYKYLKIVSKNNSDYGENDEGVISYLINNFSEKQASICKSLINSYFGEDEDNEYKIKELTKKFNDTTEKEINIGQQIYNIYKNYTEFKRMTTQTVIGSYTLEQEVNVDTEKKAGFEEKRNIILKLYEKEPFKNIITILDKYFVQGVTKFEFIRNYDILYKHLENDKDSSDLREEILKKPTISESDIEGLKSLVTRVDLSDIDDTDINKEIASFKESFMGAARVFVLVRDTCNKKVPPEYPLAGGYGKQLLKQLDNTDVRVSKAGTSVDQTKGDYKKFYNFRKRLEKIEEEGEKNNENFSVNIKDYGVLQKEKKGDNFYYYRERIMPNNVKEIIYTSGPALNYDINITQDEYETLKGSLTYNETKLIPFDLTNTFYQHKTIIESQTLNSIIEAVGKKSSSSSEDRINFQIVKINDSNLKSDITKISFDGANVKLTLKIVDSENVVPLYKVELFYNKKQGNVYRAIGDSYLMPLSENYEREGMFYEMLSESKIVKSQSFESECVLLPSQKYLNIPTDGNGFEPYPWMGVEQEKVGKVFGPFRKVAFHSSPPELFRNEFGDINKQILGSGKDANDGGSAVFFGYGFSGSGKTYTLMDKGAPGFLKTITRAQIEAGNVISEVYVKELYPYFPGHMEPETTYESELDVLKIKQIDKKFDTNDRKRIRELSVYKSKGEKVLEVEEDMCEYNFIPSELSADDGNYKGITKKKVPITALLEGNDVDTINKTPFPLVEMEFFRANARELKHNLTILGDSDGNNSFKKLGFSNFNVNNEDGSKPETITSDNAFSMLINQVAKKRKQLLQVSATPNNPDSSRSHLYIQIKFKNGGNLTIVDMAGAENTIQIQVQFLINDSVDLVDTNKKLKFTPQIYKNISLDGELKNEIPITKVPARTIALTEDTGEKERQFYGENGLVEGKAQSLTDTEYKYKKDLDNITDKDKKEYSSSMIFELFYKMFARDLVICENEEKKYFYVCGITIPINVQDKGLDNETNNGDSTTGALYKACKNLNDDIFEEDKPPSGVRSPSTPNVGKNSFFRRYLHYFPTFGTNGGKAPYAIGVFILLTIYDIALAVNYKPIGFANLYQEWKTGSFYKNTNPINEKSLGSLITTFEDKIKTSIITKNPQNKNKATLVKESDFNYLKNKASRQLIKDDSINYNFVFSNYSSLTEDKKKLEIEMIILKVLKQLDLEYLADPKLLLKTDGDIYIMDQINGNKDEYIIVSPFVWIYYRIKNIVMKSFKLTENDINGIEIDDSNSQNILLCRLIILKVIFAYINLIVEQGKGIVTSLEHLKYFFLYNTNKQEGLYGYNFKQIDPKARFYHKQKTAPLDATTWKKSYLESLKGSSNATDGYFNVIGDGWDKSDDFYKVDLLKQTSIYHRPVYLKKLDKYILERVNKGSIDRFRMLRNLIFFGQQCSLNEDVIPYPSSSNSKNCQFIEGDGNIKICKEKGIFDVYKSKPKSVIKNVYPFIKALLDFKKNLGDKKKYNKDEIESFSSLNIVPHGPKGKALNTYIMMAHIMRGVFQEDGYVDLTDRGKYSDATIATLEFAQSIKSDVGICKPVEQVIKYNRYNPEFEFSTENCQDIYKIDKNFEEEIDLVINGKQSQIGKGRGEMVCSYRTSSKPSIENMYKLLRLVDTKKFSNNKFYGNVNKYLKILNKDGSIKSKKNIMNISNRFRSKKRNSKSPSRFLIRHYKR